MKPQLAAPQEDWEAALVMEAGQGQLLASVLATANRQRQQMQTIPVAKLIVKFPGMSSTLFGN